MRTLLEFAPFLASYQLQTGLAEAKPDTRRLQTAGPANATTRAHG